jgi:hypothetical protein
VVASNSFAAGTSCRQVAVGRARCRFSSVKHWALCSGKKNAANALSGVGQFVGDACTRGDNAYTCASAVFPRLRHSLRTPSHVRGAHSSGIASVMASSESRCSSPLRRARDWPARSDERAADGRPRPRRCQRCSSIRYGKPGDQLHRLWQATGRRLIAGRRPRDSSYCTTLSSCPGAAARHRLIGPRAGSALRNAAALFSI